MQYLVWALIAIGLGVTAFRFIKARRLGDGLSFAFWLTLGVASITGSPVARYLALGLLVASFLAKRRSPRGVSKPGKETDRSALNTTRTDSSQAIEEAATPDPEAFIESIPECAENCVTHAKILTSKALDYTPESLTTVDEIISKGWGGEPPALLDPMITLFGSYVGETLRRNLGGKWAHSADFGYALVEIDGRDFKAFPFNKVSKRFTEGEGDSVAFFYEALKHTLDRKSEEDDSD